MTHDPSTALRAGARRTTRIGIGWDIHRLVEGRPLILGGVKIPFEKGLIGHSDGDALLHAIADAMFGACAFGDIGAHFPDTDPKLKDADSTELFREVLKLVASKGYKPSNIDANIIAEKPKLAQHIPAIRESVAGILQMNIDSVSIKPRTNEGFDAIGRGEAIAVQAIVLLEPAK